MNLKYITLEFLRHGSTYTHGLVARHRFGTTNLAVLLSGKVHVTDALRDWGVESQRPVESFEEGLDQINATIAALEAWFAAEDAKKMATEALLTRFVSHFVPGFDEDVTPASDEDTVQ